MEAKTTLDPQAAELVREWEARDVPAWHELPVEEARRLEDDLFGGDGTPVVGEVIDDRFSLADREIPVRIYRPGDDAHRPTLVYYHGGGWVLGTLDSVDDICRELAVRTGCLVVSVDYRLAPEHPFPAPLGDAIAALEWVAEEAASIGADPDRLGVAGTSAGGNLAAATALAAREFDGPDLIQQVLLYPIADYAFDTDSYEENAEGPFLTRTDMEWFWERYLRHPVDGWNPFASVVRATDLADLPPAVVVTCGHDPLRDEGVAYATALADAGVDVTHEHLPSLPHGALSLTDRVDAADDAMAGVAGAIRSIAGIDESVN